MLALQILLGLGVAIFQSCAYVFSRFYVVRYKQGVMGLVILGHLIMGLVCLAVLPFVTGGPIPPFRTYLYPLFWATVGDFVGQVAFFSAVRFSDASRVSPLLSLKVICLALISIMFFQGHLTSLQWAGVMLAAVSALVLNYAGGKLPGKTIIAILVACVAYSLADIYIGEMMKVLEPMGAMQSSIYGVCLSYITLGLVSLLLVPWWRFEDLRGQVRYASVYSLFWIVAMICLYASFLASGVIFSTILQSSRGIFSILIGAMVVKMGWDSLEQRTTRSVFVRRMTAAALMCLAIAMYSIRAS